MRTGTKKGTPHGACGATWADKDVQKGVRRACEIVEPRLSTLPYLAFKRGAVGLQSSPNLDTTEPKVRQSERSVEQHDADPATRHGGGGVGRTGRSKVGHIDVEVIVPRCGPGGRVE